MYNGADRDGQNGNPGLSGYGYATENTRPTSGGASSDGFRQSWMSFDGFTCNEPSRGLAEEWPNF